MLRASAHISAPYKRMEWETLIKILLSLDFGPLMLDMSLDNDAVIFSALSATALIWIQWVSFLSTTLPRYLSASLTSTDTSEIWRTRFDEKCLYLVRSTTSVLSAANSSPCAFSQSPTIVVIQATLRCASWLFLGLIVIAMSSAKPTSLAHVGCSNCNMPYICNHRWPLAGTAAHQTVAQVFQGYRSILPSWTRSWHPG